MNASSFNGAAGLHQRKPKRAARDSADHTGTFNGAAGLHQRKLEDRVRPRAIAIGAFNGAAGLHQRKPAVAVIVETLAVRPSMGPLVYTSGNRFGPVRPIGPIPPSMGPLVYTSGNAEMRAVMIERQRLQWGRWFTPAETLHAAATR